MPFFHRKPLSRCIALSALLSTTGAMLLAPNALAVGLGEVALQSPLGKPLEARIPLTHLGDLSSDQIKVMLGSDDDYTRLGVDRDYLHSQIRMQPVIEGANAYLHITTTQPVVEPYINFVISLRWPNGQLAREYTLLLDVPTMATPAPTSAAAAVEAPIGNISAAAAAADTAPRTYAPPPRSPSTAPAMPLDGRYRTAPGDSLWALAQRLRPAGVSAEQMMAALYAANPDAFVGGDPARMMAAIELKVPEASEATAATPLPSSAPAAAEAAPSEAADRFAGTRATDTPATEPAAADTEPPATGGPRLELLAPTDIEQLTVENAALREEVKSLTSSVGTLTTQLDRSEQRLEQMEAQMQQVLAGYDRQRGVDGAAAAGSTSPFADGAGQAVAAEPTDNDGIAAAQPVPEREGSLWMHLSYWIALGAVGGWALYQHSRKRREEEVEETFEPVAVVPTPAPVAPVVKPAPARVVSRDSMADVRRDIFSAEPAKAAPAKTAPLPPEAPADTASEWGTAEDNERYWHHHKDDVEELPLDLLDAEPVSARAPSPFASAGGGSAGVEDSVDASISAGVFVAFGRYSEAEQVLLEALQRDPSRQDLRLQLLDVYQQGDMREAFEQLAKTIEIECADAPEIVAEVAALRDSYSGRF